MVEKSFDTKLFAVLVIYLTSLIASNTLGLKLMPFLFGTHLSVAVFFFPFVFLTTDVVGQVYGKAMAKNFVRAGFLSTILFLAYNVLSALMPWSSSANWVKDSYETVFGVSVRISIASLLAFFIAEYQDVFVFFLAKDKLKTKTFFWRSTISNLWSQLLDTGIFMLVAFVGVYPLKTILLMSLPWWIYKVLMGLFYSPLSYFGLRFLTTPYANQNPEN